MYHAGFFCSLASPLHSCNSRRHPPPQSMPGSKQGRTACHPDAVRFCKAELDTNGDDASAILPMPTSNRERMSVACRKMLADNGSRAAEPNLRLAVPPRHRGKSNAGLSRHDPTERPSRSHHRRAGVTPHARHARQAAPKTALKSAKVPYRCRPQSAAPLQRILRRTGGGSRKSS
jgi:hypothetical protein